jgi:hypothetical protein
MVTKNEIALISTGWGPRCLSQAGVTLLSEVYRVETFGLDPDTRAMIGQLHSLSRHSPNQDTWQNSELLAVAARALRLAQSDERAALVTPSGAIATAIWPVVQAAAAKLDITVRVAHGLGLAESLANCFQLPLPPTTELRPLLSDFVGEQRMPSLAIAQELGDLTNITQLYASHGAFFVVDLFAQRVVSVDLDAPPVAAPNHLFVATQGALALAVDNDDSPDISDTIATTADWFELLNGLTGVARG